MRPRALVFDLYGEHFRYTGGAVKLGALTELMGVFGVEPATVRVVMTRLRKEGWFDSAKTGREVSYLLNDKSWRLLDDGRARIFERHFDDWDRTWTQALVDEDGHEPRAAQAHRKGTDLVGVRKLRGSGLVFASRPGETTARDARRR